ncbi:MAG: nucleotide exchange factor GrpE [Synergistaceae bacterium]|nr:nucleotide exchange factor GrpE [Synergistaceae bacterium]
MDEELTQTQNEEIQEESPDSNSSSELEEKIKSLEHDLAVARADFYNYRQRAIKERNETRKRASEDVIIAILPVLDNLDRALDAAHHGDANNILSGVEMVQRQFISVLEGLGVSAIKSQGEKFDPALHDASGTELVNDPELEGKVITERLKGYRTSERVLRPSQVTVGKIDNKQ